MLPRSHCDTLRNMKHPVGSVRITLLVENLAQGRCLLGEHGLSYWIETPAGRVLFDTGQGRAIGNNASVLGIDLTTLDALVLSHGHYDHTGGVAALPSAGREIAVYAHPDAFGPKYSQHDDRRFYDAGMPAAARIALASEAYRLVETREPTCVLPGVWVTGEVARHTPFEDVGGAFFVDDQGREPDQIRDDQSLVVDVEGGSILVLGCGHAGLINILRHVQTVMGRPRILGIIGGMHLLHADEERINATLAVLDREQIPLLAPCHCTGIEATARLRNQFGATFKTVAAGSALSW